MLLSSCLRALKSESKRLRTAATRARKAGPKNTFFRPNVDVLEDRTLLSTVTWTAGGSGDWSGANNWTDENSVHRVPGPDDDAVINTAGITVTHSTGADAVNSLTSAADFTLSGGSLAVNSAVSPSVIQGTFNWEGGALKGSGTLNAQGGIDITRRDHNLEGMHLINGDQATDIATWTGGNVFVYSGGTFTNNGRFLIQTPSIFGQNSGQVGGTFENSSGGRVIQLDLGQDQGAYFGLNVDNSGSIEVHSGGLGLGVFGGTPSQSTSSGTIVGDPGTNLTFEGNWAFPSAGSGHVSIAGSGVRSEARASLPSTAVTLSRHPAC